MDEAKHLGERLKNLLRHKLSHQWVCYEFFYPNIDKTTLGGENDFRACLRESFPQLKTRSLTRAEWSRVRRLMGKPRRCSQAFLAEERTLLSNKRNKIRQLQQQKVVDLNYFRDLPDQVPLSLVIGTRVTAILHEPRFGLFNGTIDAVDTKGHGYRITFDKSEVGTHTVPDYEVLSIDPPEFLPLSSFQTRIKPRRPVLKSPKFLEILGQQVTEALINRTDDVGSHIFMPDSNEEGGVGQYPIKLLALMVRVSKILSMKKKKIFELKSMNDEVERLHSIEQPVPLELKRTYASTILDLEKLNSDLDDHLKAVQIYSNELSIDTNCIPDPDYMKQRCTGEAKELIDNLLPNYEIVNEASISAITHMMTVMCHLKSLSENNDNSLQLKALDETMHEYKSKLPQCEKSYYEDNIEIHVNYIKKI